MRKLLLLIFLLALLLRIYKLPEYPFGFHSDEARVGWNTYSIAQTGKDDRGNINALYYNTFGDYRPTGIFYFTLPSILIFGLNEFAVRFPSALFGAASVVIFYLFVKELSNNKALAYLGSFLLAISVWHIPVSRATSEVVISLFFTLLGVFLLLRAINNNAYRYLTWSFVSFLVSYLLYHSIRLLAPIICLTIIIYFWRKIKIKKQILIYLAGIFLLTFALLLTKGGQGRFSQVSILKNDRPVYVTVTEQYLQYFSGNFLIGNDALPQRYKTPEIGMLLYAELILFLIGVYIAIKQKKYTLILILFLVTPLAAALTNEDSPNLHRSLLMLPFIEILVAVGLLHLIKSNLLQKLFAVFLIILLSVNQFYFFRQYTKVATITNASVRNSEVKTLALFVNEMHDEYEQVIITNDPDDIYPWFAFFNKLDPQEFNQFAIKRSDGPWQNKNITFSQSECPSGDEFPGKFDPPSDKNILVIDGFRCAVGSKITDGMQAKVLRQFKYPDGSTAYTVWIRN